MTQYETIRLLADPDGVSRIVLDRPQKRNALSATLIGELRSAFAALGADETVRVVILAAEGDYFCAGADLAWFEELTKKDRAGRVAQAAQMAALLDEINSVEKPVVARIQGPAFGGGVGLVAACDAAVASATASFALPEVRLGVIPAMIGPFLVARVGEGAARHLILSGKTIDAAEAHRIGLVSVLAPPGDLDSVLDSEIAQFAKGLPGAVGIAKTFVRNLAGSRGKELDKPTYEYLADCLGTDEAKQAIAAFLARSRRSKPKK
jgi:methylglutaconyl-CoA hydratase